MSTPNATHSNTHLLLDSGKLCSFWELFHACISQNFDHCVRRKRSIFFCCYNRFTQTSRSNVYTSFTSGGSDPASVSLSLKNSVLCHRVSEECVPSMEVLWQELKSDFSSNGHLRYCRQKPPKNTFTPLDRMTFGLKWNSSQKSLCFWSYRLFFNRHISYKSWIFPVVCVLVCSDWLMRPDASWKWQEVLLSTR